MPATADAFGTDSMTHRRSFCIILDLDKKVLGLKYYKKEEFDKNYKLAGCTKEGIELHNSEIERLLKYEAEVLGDLDHHCIVKCRSGCKEGIICWANGTETCVYYIIEDYICGVTLTKLLPYCTKDAMLRVIIYDIVCALLYLNGEGRCHLDLKPDNVMVDENGNIVLIDFATANKTAGPRGDGKQRAVVGTPCFKAEEVKLENPAYNGPAADAFSLGVIIYAIAFKCFPFNADRYGGFEGDPVYREFREHKYSVLWKNTQQFVKLRRETELLGRQWALQQGKKPDEIPQETTIIYSPELEVIITGLLAADPCVRLTISEVFETAWMQAGFANEAAERKDIGNIVSQLMKQDESTYIHKS